MVCSIGLCMALLLMCASACTSSCLTLDVAPSCALPRMVPAVLKPSLAELKSPGARTVEPRTDGGPKSWRVASSGSSADRPPCRAKAILAGRATGYRMCCRCRATCLGSVLGNELVWLDGVDVTT